MSNKIKCKKGWRRCVICFKAEGDSKTFYAKFPRDESRCKEWVKVVGDPDLVHLPIEKLSRVRYVCGDHFDKKYFNRKMTRLRNETIPTLNLLSPPLSEEQLKDFPLHMHGISVDQKAEDVSQTSMVMHDSNDDSFIILISVKQQQDNDLITVPGESRMMDSQDLSPFYGQCRCCSEEGNHKDLFKEYWWEGIREVYSVIFQECFNLSFSTKANLSTLICAKCIERLRDASSFKSLAISTEAQLTDAVEFKSDENIVSNYVKKNPLDMYCVKLENELDSVVKVDSWVLEQSGDDYSVGDRTHCEMGQEKESRAAENLVEGELELISRFPSAELQTLPTRDTLKFTCGDFAKHLKDLEGQHITGKTIEILLNNNATDTELSSKHREISKPPKKKRTKRKKTMKTSNVERLAHATNISALLEFSNVIAFKAKHRRAYPCFYCEMPFEDFEDLRKHQNNEHTKENMIQRVLKKYRRGSPESLVVYVDVRDLKCSVCDSGIANLNDLKVHLTRVHGKKMHLELSDRVIPFKMEENRFECQICANFYETFGSIERHMNNHYRHYVCEDCDSGFVTKQRLKIHGYLMHSTRVKEYPCGTCQKIFATQQKRRSHVETVHENVKKYKCNRCPETFNEYFRRHKHMVLAHGVAPIEYKCNVCEKTFARRYSLSTHMRTHIQQKDVYCDLCPYRCFTKVELRHHMVKHDGPRIYECSVCKKSYAREKTLKEHMRIHTNDRRYVCPVCGLAFIQNCSLKSHVRSHHKEYGLM